MGAASSVAGERTWTALQLFHCFSSASPHGTSPAHFGLLIKGKHNAQYDSLGNKCRRGAAQLALSNCNRVVDRASLKTT